MTKNNNKQGIMVNGSLAAAGVSFYTRWGQTIMRTALSRQPVRRTQKQFEQRERLAHNITLWKVIRCVCRPLFTQGGRAYDCFRTLATKLPALYITREEHFDGLALLLPGIPVSCGTLPDVAYRLGQVEGRPALLTDLTPALLGADDLLLVGLVYHRYGEQLKLEAEAEPVAVDDMVAAEGGLALVDARFGDSDSGWALVRRSGGRCSTQRLVTACLRHEAYRTPEALQRAAASYGGLTPGV